MKDEAAIPEAMVLESKLGAGHHGDAAQAPAGCGQVSYQFNLEDKLNSASLFDNLLETSAVELNVAWLQRGRFVRPVLTPKHDQHLGLVVPHRDFGLADLRSTIGSRRQIDVFDVVCRKTNRMMLKEFHLHWDTAPDHRERLLSVSRFELTGTKLNNKVRPPRLVRQVDWVSKVWPLHLNSMVEGGQAAAAADSIYDVSYPKVQKYCFLAMKHCWADFHVNFGGASAWHHLLSGSMVFWLVEPTNDNLKLYMDWVQSGAPGGFFADRCGGRPIRVKLEAGQTLLIPAGWIHAHYTLSDSISFGGYFLHSFSIEKQLQVAHMEQLLKVPDALRYPFFTEMLWYCLERYVHCLTGESLLELPEDEKRLIRLEKGDHVNPNREVLKVTEPLLKSEQHLHLTQSEIHGLKYIVIYLYHLPSDQKNVPVIIPDPVKLVKSIRSLILQHKEDCSESAVTGKLVLRWIDNHHDLAKMEDANLPHWSATLPGGDGAKASTRTTGNRCGHKDCGSAKQCKKCGTSPTSNSNRRRRVRCKSCSACIGNDCRICVYCKDMTKYGGPGRMKQTCEKRRCLSPQLPVCAFCSVCRLDGWYLKPKVPSKEADRPEEPPQLFECTVCLEIMHPDCAEKTIGLGQINPNLHNSWECARCVASSFQAAARTKSSCPQPTPPPQPVPPSSSSTPP